MSRAHQRGRRMARASHRLLAGPVQAAPHRRLRAQAATPDRVTRFSSNFQHWHALGCVHVATESLRAQIARQALARLTMEVAAS